MRETKRLTLEADTFDGYITLEGIRIEVQGHPDRGVRIVEETECTPQKL